MGTLFDRRWPRVIAESTAVVVSILLAFTIDAWWVERSDRQAEREELSRLYEEFSRNRDRLHEDVLLDSRSGQNRAYEGGARLLEMLRAHKGPEETVAVSNRLLLDVTAAPSFDATTPVLDGLILSGRLEIIEDRNVLSAISEWNRWVSQTSEVELHARDLALGQLYPALAERGNLGGVLDEENLDRQISMRVDDEILGLVALRVRMMTLALSNLSDLRDSADGVLEAIDLAQAR